MTKNKLIILLAVSIVGIITGICSIILNNMMFLMIDFIKTTPQVNLFIIPVIGGLIVGVINHYYIDERHRGFGLNEVIKETKQINQLVMTPKSILIKMVGALVTIVSGLSAGRQAPVIHLGGGIGSNVAYYFKFNNRVKKRIIYSGVAGALAGIFQRPFFALFFVLEVLCEDDYIDNFIDLSIASFVSYLISLKIGSSHILINISRTQLLDTLSFDFVGLFGLSALLVIISLLYMKSFEVARKVVNNYKYDRIIIGMMMGLITAIIGSFVPLIFDIYYGSISIVIVRPPAIFFLVVLMFVKIIATSMTIESGGIGGTFTPGLFIGAIAGSIYGQILVCLGIDSAFNPIFPLFAIGGILASFMSAPVSASIMIGMISGNYLYIPYTLVFTFSINLLTKLIYKKNIFSQ